MRIVLAAAIASAVALGAWLWWSDRDRPAAPSDTVGSAEGGSREDAIAHLGGGGAVQAPSRGMEASADARLPGPDVRVRGAVRGMGTPLTGAWVEVYAPDDPGMPGWPGPATWSRSSAPRSGSRAEALTAVSSGPEGRFVATVPRRSRLTLRVAARGFAAHTQVVCVPAVGDPPPRVVDLAPGFDVNGVQVRPGPAPVVGATVRLLRRTRFAPARPDGPVLAVETTGEGGRFRLGAHPAGAGALYVHLDEHRVARYPLEVPTQGELRIVLPPPASLAGHITDAAGEPVSGGEVRISVDRADGSGMEGTATSRADGSYLVAGLQPGAVQNVTVTPAHGTALSAVHGDLDVALPVLSPGAAATLDVVLSARGRLVGRVTNEAGDPQPGAQASLFRLEPPARVAVRTASGDGAFAFEGVARGRYALLAFGARGDLAGSVGTDEPSPNHGIPFDPAAPQAPIEVVVRPLGGVEGRVENAPRA